MKTLFSKTQRRQKMTQLMYRGFVHEKCAQDLPSAAKAMIYRGHRHNGIAPRVSRAADGMRYRGVAFARSSEGHVTVTTPPIVAKGLAA
jgi:hypothetical protein